ncbi:MAG: hypothetical protein ACRC5M_03735 [Anaeroplasmataceae bacterium]
MTKWEYKIHVVPANTAKSITKIVKVDELNELGLLGWELVKINFTGYGGAECLFKRPLLEKKD